MERDLKCMYCAESGITNTDVFIEIVDVELGAGWICKECFIESEKEKDEHLKELEEELQAKKQECSFNTLKIIALQEALEQYETENDQLKRKEEIIEKLKEKHNAMCKSCPRNISCDECFNNTTLKILNGEIV